jgi:hypothetical protein
MAQVPRTAKVFAVGIEALSAIWAQTIPGHWPGRALWIRVAPLHAAFSGSTSVDCGYASAGLV